MGRELARSRETVAHRRAMSDGALRDAVRDSPVPVVTTFLAVDGLSTHLTVRDAQGNPTGLLVDAATEN